MAMNILQYLLISSDILNFILFVLEIIGDGVS